MPNSTNQAPLHNGFKVFSEDSVLQTLAKDLPQSVVTDLTKLGQWAGSPEALDLARLANEHPPVLRTHDGRGERLDVVEFHPAYHALMRRAVSNGIHCSTWDETPQEKGNRNLIRCMRAMMTYGLEAGHMCPITMTNASLAVFMTDPDLLRDWMPKIVSRQYDSS